MWKELEYKRCLNADLPWFAARLQTVMEVRETVLRKPQRWVHSTTTLLDYIPSKLQLCTLFDCGLELNGRGLVFHLPYPPIFFFIFYWPSASFCWFRFSRTTPTESYASPMRTERSSAKAGTKVPTSNPSQRRATPWGTLCVLKNIIMQTRSEILLLGWWNRSFHVG